MISDLRGTLSSLGFLIVCFLLVIVLPIYVQWETVQRVLKEGFHPDTTAMTIVVPTLEWVDEATFILTSDKVIYLRTCEDVYVSRELITNMGTISIGAEVEDEMNSDLWHELDSFYKLSITKGTGPARRLRVHLPFGLKRGDAILLRTIGTITKLQPCVDGWYGQGIVTLVPLQDTPITTHQARYR